jgi:translation initiation factor 2 alpha subunit (eIF-2alpha)
MTVKTIKEWLNKFPEDADVDMFIGYVECPMYELRVTTSNGTVVDRLDFED